MGREKILSRLKANKPDLVENLPVIPGFPNKSIDLIDGFHKALENNNASVVRAKYEDDLSKIIRSNYPKLKKTISTVPGIAGAIALDFSRQPNEFEDVELVIAKGEIGVAENGGVWVSDHSMPIRVLPFITQYLVLVVDSLNIVPKMHQAYKKISPEKLGFGTFISGPSKTGDIEQALVIGAHGPLGLTVIIQE